MFKDAVIKKKKKIGLFEQLEDKFIVVSIELHNKLLMLFYSILWGGHFTLRGTFQGGVILHYDNGTLVSFHWDLLGIY